MAKANLILQKLDIRLSLLSVKAADQVLMQMLPGIREQFVRHKTDGRDRPFNIQHNGSRLGRVACLLTCWPYIKMTM